MVSVQNLQVMVSMMNTLSWGDPSSKWQTLACVLSRPWSGTRLQTRPPLLKRFWMLSPPPKRRGDSDRVSKQQVCLPVFSGEIVPQVEPLQPVKRNKKHGPILCLFIPSERNHECSLMIIFLRHFPQCAVFSYRSFLCVLAQLGLVYFLFGSRYFSIWYN